MSTLYRQVIPTGLKLAITKVVIVALRFVSLSDQYQRAFFVLPPLLCQSSVAVLKYPK
jgi:hypothetical protein